MSKWNTLLLVALSAISSTVCLGQFETATVLGTAIDDSGASIPACRVTLENVNTGVTNVATTNEAGKFEFINVAIGTYRIKGEAKGFKALMTEQFAVSVGARQRVDLKLSLGEMSQTVSVTGAAAAIETESSDRGQVVNNVTIVNLPLNGRSYADLALLAPGVRKSVLGMDQSSSNYRDASFNVNGLRSSLNNFQVDGVDNNTYATSNQGYSNQVVQLSPDAVSEFKVQTNNYSRRVWTRRRRHRERLGEAAAPTSSMARPGTTCATRQLNAVGFFKPAQNRQAVVPAEPVRRRARWAHRQEQDLLLRRLRRPAAHHAYAVLS